MVKHQHSLCILGSDTCNQAVVAISDLSICINSSQHGVIGIPYGLAVGCCSQSQNHNHQYKQSLHILCII